LSHTLSHLSLPGDVEENRQVRPQLAACLKALRSGDTLVVWKLDCLGRNRQHLGTTVNTLHEAGISFKVLSGQGANIDTTTLTGKLVLGIFAALAEYERELIRERTIAGLASARARGHVGGRPFKMTATKLRMAISAMQDPQTRVAELCYELGMSRQTLINRQRKLVLYFFVGRLRRFLHQKFICPKVNGTEIRVVGVAHPNVFKAFGDRYELISVPFVFKVFSSRRFLVFFEK
jgi:hypothetical protein